MKNGGENQRKVLIFGIIRQLSATFAKPELINDQTQSS